MRRTKRPDQETNAERIATTLTAAAEVVHAAAHALEAAGLLARTAEESTRINEGHKAQAIAADLTTAALRAAVYATATAEDQVSDLIGE